MLLSCCILPESKPGIRLGFFGSWQPDDLEFLSQIADLFCLIYTHWIEVAPALYPTRQPRVVTGKSLVLQVVLQHCL
jgi:hypothetical protein